MNATYPLTRIADDMTDRALEIVTAQAYVMIGYAQIFVNVDTGSLRDSIRLEVVPCSGEGDKSVRVRAGGYIVNPKTGKLVDYAVYQERSSPFMQPAWDMVSQSIYENLCAMEGSLSE